AWKYAGQSWSWPALQRAYRRRRPDRLRPRLQAWPRRHRVEAQGLRLPLRPLASLAEDEEPGCTGREARRGRGLESAALVGGPEPDGAYFFQFTFFSLGRVLINRRG